MPAERLSAATVHATAARLAAPLVGILGDAPEGAGVRDLATAILQEHVHRGRRGLAVCAAASGAGVTTTAAGLAVALAQAGVQTLVVEANLRRPSIEALITPGGPTEPGLLQFLTGEVSEPPAVVTHEVWPNLSVIYAGGSQPAVQDLFDTERFEELMQYALRTYELTVVDAPPANRCAETRRIAAVAGYAAVVARRDVTMADDMRTLVADLGKSRVEVIGAIFNEG